PRRPDPDLRGVLRRVRRGVPVGAAPRPRPPRDGLRSVPHPRPPRRRAARQRRPRGRPYPLAHRDDARPGRPLPRARDELRPRRDGRVRAHDPRRKRRVRGPARTGGGDPAPPACRGRGRGGTRAVTCPPPTPPASPPPPPPTPPPSTPAPSLAPTTAAPTTPTPPTRKNGFPVPP